MRKRITELSRPVQLTAAVGVLVFGLGGTATAAKLIDGSDIKNGTITSADVKNGTITSADLADRFEKALDGKDGKNGKDGAQGPKGDTGPQGAKGDTGAQGETGPQGAKGDTGAQGETGPQGAKGDTGARGPQGEPGQALVGDDITPANSNYPTNNGFANVMEVNNVPANSGAPSTSDTKLASVNVAEPGKYLVQGTVQFFDFSAVTAGTEYGVAGVFVGDSKVGTLWTSDIPDDINNGAQASGTLLITTTQPNTEVAVHAVIRGSESNGGQAGANLIVTRLG